MHLSHEQQQKGERFSGMAALYDDARPSLPAYPVEWLTRYLGRRPDLVVDLGCGPGLSTLAWQGCCRQAIGIEPNRDMLAHAIRKAGADIAFRQGFGHDTGLPDGCADIVVSSQAFHWMEPAPTLREVCRILREGGIFSTVDYDWPPVCDWEAEVAYHTLCRQIKALCPDDPRDKLVHSKEQHLAHIRQSGLFRYSRELLFSARECCTVQRLYQMTLSKSSLQYAAQNRPTEAQALFDAYQAVLQRRFGEDVFPIELCYRMRIGIK